MTSTNQTIGYEVEGFEFAMKMLNAPARMGWSREQVLEFAEQMQAKLTPSQKGAGFMEAARIVARTRPHREDKQRVNENYDLVGKYFYNDNLHPNMRVCCVLGVAEVFTKDIVFESVDNQFTHVEFASFVRPRIITDDTLETAILDGRAEMVVDQINHREIVWSGCRFYLAWNSNVPGWIIYRVEPEESESHDPETN